MSHSDVGSSSSAVRRRTKKTWSRLGRVGSSSRRRRRRRRRTRRRRSRAPASRASTATPPCRARTGSCPTSPPTPTSLLAFAIRSCVGRRSRCRSLSGGVVPCRARLNASMLCIASTRALDAQCDARARTAPDELEQRRAAAAERPSAGARRGSPPPSAPRPTRRGTARGGRRRRRRGRRPRRRCARRPAPTCPRSPTARAGRRSARSSSVLLVVGGRDPRRDGPRWRSTRGRGRRASRWRGRRPIGRVHAVVEPRHEVHLVAPRVRRGAG